MLSLQSEKNSQDSESVEILSKSDDNENEIGRSTREIVHKATKTKITWNFFALVALFLSLSGNVFLLTRRSHLACSTREIMIESNSYCKTSLLYKYSKGKAQLKKAPAIEANDPQLQLTRYKGTFGWPSRWAGDPNPQVDVAWHEISELRMGRISEEELLQFRFKRGYVSIPKQYRGGYMVHFEFAHQLHCLDILRMTSWFNFDHYQTSRPLLVTDSKLFRGHVRHCVEMLRQVLMCQADLGAIPLVWVRNRTWPVPDFNTWHKCKNWDSVIQWAQERSVPPMNMWTPNIGDLILEVDPLAG